MGIDIAFIAIGGLALVLSGLQSTWLHGPLSRWRDQSPNVLSVDISSTIGFVAVGFFAIHVSDGEPAWLRVTSMLAALVASAAIFAAGRSIGRRLEAGSG